MRLEDEKGWQNLIKSKKEGEAAAAEIAEGQEVQEAVRALLGDLDAEAVHTSRENFVKLLKAEAKERDLKLAAPLLKAVLSALSERDPEAEVCTVKGSPEPDTDLRDNENVPLTEDIDDYMAREVLPHVPDAWVDASKTKVGPTKSPSPGTSTCTSRPGR